MLYEKLYTTTVRSAATIVRHRCYIDDLLYKDTSTVDSTNR